MAQTSASQARAAVEKGPISPDQFFLLRRHQTLRQIKHAAPAWRFNDRDAKREKAR
jgi:hypothetical protein